MKKNYILLGLLTISQLSFGQAQITDSPLPEIIDFDHTISNVNYGSFTDVIHTNQNTGTLDAGAWFVAEDYNPTVQNLNFNTIYPVVSNPFGSLDPRVNSTELAPGNRLLTWQPNGSDFNPGAIVLRMQNAATTDLVQIELSYKLYINNDNGRSHAVSLHFGDDNNAFMEEVSARRTTGAAATNPSLSYETVTVTIDLSNRPLAPGAFFYIKWLTSTDGGGGNSDEMGLDDISIKGMIAEPLPLNLLSFNVISEGSANVLEWTTTNETDFSHFELEWTNDKSNEFSEIAKMRSSEMLVTNMLDRKYSFLHEVRNGMHFYRLKMIDLDGNYSYSKIININKSNTIGAGFEIYPNPVTDGSINVVTKSATIDKVVIVDISGKELIRKVISDQATSSKIDVSALQSGTYFVIITSNGNQQILKLVK